MYAFNSLPNEEYSNLFIVAGFSRKSEILAVCLSKSY